MASDINYTVVQLSGKWFIAYASDKQPNPKLISVDKFIERLESIEHQLWVDTASVSLDALDDAAVVRIAAKFLQTKLSEDN